jgi:hypothetical protein
VSCGCARRSPGSLGELPAGTLETLGFLLVTGVILVGGGLAYGIFVEAPRERRYAKRVDSGRRRAYTS